ncbi:MAG: DUF3153 domain-containing protein [Microcoleaceae cyanobacterium]
MASIVQSIIRRVGVFVALFLAATLLSGCVQSDIEVQFQDQTHGQIVQTIQLTERVSSLSPTAIDEWIRGLEHQVRQVHGRIKRVSNQTLEVTIPFYNGSDLEEKFNQFFNPPDPTRQTAKESEIPAIASHLDLTQRNLFFALRNQLNLQLDLRSLSVLSAQDQVLIDSGDLLNLEFSLLTPWGTTVVQSSRIQSSKNLVADSDALTVATKQSGKQTVWTLKPGEINQLSAVFWVPSPVGIGFVVIALFVALGILLRHRLFPLKVQQV